MKNQIENSMKRTYSEPKMELITLDYEISLALESDNPPIFEASLGIESMESQNLEPFNIQ